MSAPGTAAPIDDDEAERLFAFLKGKALLLAVSGGPDSMAMLHLAEAVATRLELTLAVATVDHGLRPEARDECRLVEAAALGLGLPHATLIWPDPATTDLQDRARAARYDLLTRHAAGLGIADLLTAHTLDDQAETVLFRLIRGSGVDGLAGMRRSIARGEIMLHRPLLEIEKVRLVATCEARRSPHVSDPSNVDPRFARPRLRKLLPLLEKEGLDAARFAALARRADRAREALDGEARRLFATIARNDARGAYRLEAAGFAAAASEIRLRVLLLALEAVRPAAGREAGAAPLRLRRAEALVDALGSAIDAGAPLARSLAGCAIRLERSGAIIVAEAPPRRRRG